jgi:beta-lactam-binding protein with PASTA domain
LSEVITEETVIGTITLAGRRIYVLVSTGKIPADAQ